MSPDPLTMRVHLKLGDKVEVIPNVGLRDGYKAVVDDVLASTAGVPFHSPLWYKSLLVAAVYIDCDSREVHWVRTDSTLPKTVYEIDARFAPSGAEKLNMSSDVDIYDFDPTIDELTTLASECMALYGKKKMWTELCTDVTRILHCYVFPCIKFRKGDISALQDALRLVESKSTCIEAEILQKSRSIDLTDVSLHNQRRRIIKNEKFESELYVRSCHRDFLVPFCKDIEKDIVRLNGELDAVQLEVNKHRDSNVSECAKVKLDELRKRRDEIHGQLTPLQHAKETLRNVLFRKSVIKKKVLRKIKVKKNIFHDIYMEISCRLRQQKEELHKSCLGKVKLSAVREAIFTTFSELNTSDEEYISIYPSDGSEFSLDMIGIDEKPSDWKTMEEKVGVLLETKSSLAYLKHHQACMMIKDKITSAIDDTKLFSYSVQSGSNTVSISSVDVRLIEELGQSSRKRRSGRPRSTLTGKSDLGHEFTPDLEDESNRLAADALRMSLEGIRDDVKSQMEAMSQLLRNTLPNCDGRHNLHKMWVSYENIFYLEMLPHLCTLYEQVYEPKCENLYRKISRLSLEAMLEEQDKILDLIVDTMGRDPPLSPSWLHPRPHSNVRSEFEILSPSEVDPSESRVSLVSIEIKKCTLHELYSMVDAECGQLTGSITNLMDEERCIHLDQSVSVLNDVIDGGDPVAVGDHGDVPSSEEDGEELQEGDDVFEVGDDGGRGMHVEVFLEALFKGTKATLQSLFKANTVLGKLRMLTKVFRSLNSLLVELNKKHPGACCDEMLSLIIILLRCLDQDTFVHLYASVVLLIDLRAPFLMGSVHDCSLTNFLCAYQYLFSQQLCWTGADDSAGGCGPVSS